MKEFKSLSQLIWLKKKKERERNHKKEEIKEKMTN